MQVLLIKIDIEWNELCLWCCCWSWVSGKVCMSAFVVATEVVAVAVLMKKGEK